MARGCTVERLAGFALYIWTGGDLFYRNRALPTAAAAASPAAISQLVRRFQAWGRVPWLDFILERWPALVLSLQQSGFCEESRMPVLVARNGGPFQRAHGRPRLLDCESSLLPQVITGMHEVFAMAPTGQEEAELASLRRDIASRSTMVAVVAVQDRVVASASLVGIGAEAELAAVWTLPYWRGRGFGAAVCSLLLEGFFRGGGEFVWLSAENRNAAAVYRRLGFEPAATQCSWRLGSA